jgi:hypothetical protein
MRLPCAMRRARRVERRMLRANVAQMINLTIACGSDGGPLVAHSVPP